MSALCPSCRDSYDGWRLYSYAGPIPRWRQDSPDGRNVDLYKERSMETLRKYKEERRELADRQCAAIKELCARKHQAVAA